MAVEIVRCPECGELFTRKQPSKRFCSPKCKAAYNNRASAAKKQKLIDEKGTGCPYNEALICTNHKCEKCGWNPAVAERRLKNGILR